MNLDLLAKEWQTAKAEEDAARKWRVEVEQKILELHPAREEGAETFKTDNGASITLTGKLTYKVNVESLQQLVADWPVDLQPIKVKTEADESRLKTIRRENPALWAKIAPAIVVRPAKTNVSIDWSE